MKITWFGGTTFRLYIGGKIIVTDADKVAGDMKPHEVAAAADHKINLSDGVADFPYLDVDNWQPRKPTRLIDAPSEEIFELYTLSAEGILVDEPAEGPAIIAPVSETAWGRFADGAVCIVYGAPETVTDGLHSILAVARPKLIAIATSELSEAQMSELIAAGAHCTIQILEHGFAIEA